MKAGINEMEVKRAIKNTSEAHSWFFGRINEIGKFCTNQKKEKIRLTKAAVKKEASQQTPRAVRAALKHHLKSYSSKLGKKKKMDEFLNLPRLN